MNLHLAEISSQVTPGAHAVLLGRRRVAPARRAIAPPAQHQPAAFAGLLAGTQPGREHLAVPRQNFLANRVFDSYDAIVDACCEAWNALIALPERIQSIAQRSWVHRSAHRAVGIIINSALIVVGCRCIIKHMTLRRNRALGRSAGDQAVVVAANVGIDGSDKPTHGAVTGASQLDSD